MKRGGELLIFFIYRGRDPFLGTHFPRKWAQTTTPVDKKRGPGTLPQSTSINGSQTRSTAATGASQSGVRTASRNHPSSRAGDQDDVSYTNSLKQVVPIGFLGISLVLHFWMCVVSVGCWFVLVGCWFVLVGCWFVLVGCWFCFVGYWRLRVGQQGFP